jgi:hypothetical protein
MTDHDLATLVREHVQRDEPPFLMSSDTVMALGRRTLVRRRARRGVAGVLVAAAAVAAVPFLPWGGGPGNSDDLQGIDPATAYALEHYDAQKMPQLIDDHARAVLSRSVDNLGSAEFSAGDGQGSPLPPKLYDKASSMGVAYGEKSDHRIRVELMHAGSEAEGDARKSCANDLTDGSVFSCEVNVSDTGDVVTTRVTALRPLNAVGARWSVVTRKELRTGIPGKGDPDQSRIDPDDVYFARTADSAHSKTFVTVAEEIVKAPSLAEAMAAFEIPSADLEQIVTDPVLVIPLPPTDDNGCQWTLPGSNITCAGNPAKDD